MSENVEATEKKTSPEIEKIDIMNLVAAFWNGFKRLWFVLVYSAVLLFHKLFLYAAVCGVGNRIRHDAGRILY